MSCMFCFVYISSSQWFHTSEVSLHQTNVNTCTEVSFLDVNIKCYQAITHSKNFFSYLLDHDYFQFTVALVRECCQDLSLILSY